MNNRIPVSYIFEKRSCLDFLDSMDSPFSAAGTNRHPAMTPVALESLSKEILISLLPHAHESLVLSRLPFINDTYKDKVEQSFDMAEARITTPKTVPLLYVSWMTTGVFIDALTSLAADDDDIVLIKNSHQANGTGQVTILGNRLYDFVSLFVNRAELTVETMPDWMGCVLPSSLEADKPFQLNQVIGSRPVAQKMVNVVAEWRFMFNCAGDMLAYERVAKGKNEYQASGDGDKLLDIEDHSRECGIFATAVAKANYVAKLSGYTYGSIDMYSDDDGVVGCFEYSNEFAFRGISPSKIHNLRHRGLLYRVLVDGSAEHKAKVYEFCKVRSEYKDLLKPLSELNALYKEKPEPFEPVNT